MQSGCYPIEPSLTLQIGWYMTSHLIRAHYGVITLLIFIAIGMNRLVRFLGPCGRRYPPADLNIYLPGVTKHMVIMIYTIQLVNHSLQIVFYVFRL